VSKDFLLQVLNQLPQDPENNIRVISNFYKNSRRYSQVKVHYVSTPTLAANFATGTAGVVDTGDK
jgi:hypothetical protein